MKDKILFCSSGGSTKFIVLAEGHRIAIQDFEIIPTDLCGVSSGSIVSLTSALGLLEPSILDIAVEIGLTLNLKDIFPDKKILKDLISLGQSPVTEEGKMSWFALYRALSGCSSLGIQNIQPLFDKFLTKQLFKDFQNSKTTPNVWVMAVAPKTMSRKLWNLKDVNDCKDFEMAKQIISASSHIPIFAQPVIIDGIGYVDGGVRNHNPSPMLIKKYKKDIKELYSFYTRPETLNLEEVVDWDENVIKVITRIMEGMSMEISKRDSEYELDEMEENEYRLCQFFYNRNLIKGQYGTNKEELKNLSESAKEITNKKLNDFTKKDNC